MGNSAGWCNAKKQVLEFAIHWLNRTNAWTPGRRNALGYPLLMLAKNFHGLDFREYVKWIETIAPDFRPRAMEPLDGFLDRSSKSRRSA